MKKISIIILYVLGFSLSNLNAEINPYPISQSTSGGIGLIQIPTARFSEDGEFLFGISSEVPYNRLFAKVQFFPWMEGVLRYTEGQYLDYYPGSKQTWKDKGLDFKFKLFDETENMPAISIGFNDFGGTGAYSSEFFVANKRFGNTDITFGLGWGRLDGVNHISNPAGWFIDDKKVRGGYSARGGKISTARLFSGENMSFFGGLEYYSPIPNLSLKLEYDPSDYKEVLGKERNIFKSGDVFEIDSRLNLAINYRLNMGDRDKVDLSLGFVRGNTIYANMAIHSNLNLKSRSKFQAPPETINIPYLESYSSLNDEWQTYLKNLIIWQMSNVGFVTHSLIFNGNELQAEISQGRFLNPVQAFDLASRILANNSPKDIEKITVINVDQGIETLRSTVDRATFVESVALGPVDENILDFNLENPLLEDAIIEKNDKLYPNFSWSILPHMLGTLQHQEKFYFYQMEALATASYTFSRQLYMTAQYGINIYNNYDTYTYHMPDGALHHVRQDRRLYLTEGESGLRRMQLDYLLDINRDLKAKVTAGIIEWMYGGIGGEIIYAPGNKTWAIGMDAYWVKQREFDQKLSFRDYDTVTGFLTYYQELPIYNMRLRVAAGKFLGKDKGIEIDISRRFNSGARIGGMVELTDCDALCVGEGSFNKWIYFKLPMDLFYTQRSTREKVGYGWSPLTKDAGTRVEPGSLYNLMIDATEELDPIRMKPWSLKKIISGFSVKPSD